MRRQVAWVCYYMQHCFNQLLRKLKYTRKKPKNYKGKIFLNKQETQDKIKEYILRGQPALIARFGSNEAIITAEAIGIELGVRRRFKDGYLLALYQNAGVFPYGTEMALRFGEISRKAAEQIDLLGAWDTPMQDYLIDQICPADMLLTSLGSLEPYCSENPWSVALRGKKVLVVHPFQETIEKQYEKRELLFSDPNVLPEFELHVLKAVQSIAGETDDRFADWCEALNYMYQEAMKIDFDVAILGCGAYGMPLAAMLKKAGKLAVHLGGATQILFGIKGRRWDNHPRISALYNEHWVRPSESETPMGATTVENACYW